MTKNKKPNEQNQKDGEDLIENQEPLLVEYGEENTVNKKKDGGAVHVGWQQC